jgi:hypothetical protein
MLKFHVSVFLAPLSARDYEAGVRGRSHDRLPCCGIGFGWFL